MNLSFDVLAIFKGDWPVVLQLDVTAPSSEIIELFDCTLKFVLWAFFELSSSVECILYAVTVLPLFI